jgi:GNAT superfamily N-acetyltransferase
MGQPVRVTCGTDPCVRRATVDDVAAIARIHVDAYEASLGEIVDRQVLDAANARRVPMWSALLGEPPDGQVVYVHDDPPISGFVSAGPSRDASGTRTGEIYTLFVDPPRWGAGVGGTLLRHGLQHLVALGLAAAKLWVLDRNLPARRFYERRGWIDLGEVREDARGRFLRYGASL